MKRTILVMTASALCYLALGVFLLVFGLADDSPAMYICSVFIFVRLFQTSLVIAGMRLSVQKTRTFPAGLYKIENLAAVLVGVVSIVFAYEVIKATLFKPDPFTWSTATFVILLSSAAVLAVVGFFKRTEGKLTNSPGIIADAGSTLTDCLALFIFTIGVAIEMSNIKYTAEIAAAGVALYMVYTGLAVIADGLKVLLDASVEQQVLDEVEGIARANPSVRSVNSVSGRNRGSLRFIDLSVELDSSDLREVASVVKDLRDDIKREVGNIDDVHVEVERGLRGTVVSVIPVRADGRTVAGGLGDAGFFRVLWIDTENGTVLSRKSYENPATAGRARAPVRLAVVIARRGPDLLMTSSPIDDPDVVATLDAYGVETVSCPGAVDAEDSQDAIAELVLTRCADRRREPVRRTREARLEED